MSNEIKEKEEYEKYARDHRKELNAQEVRLGDVVTVLVGHFAGEKGVIVGMIACNVSDYTDPYYEIEMECDVPEEFRVRKTLIGQSRVIGGVEKRYLKVVGNHAPKQPSMEIKQGDRVRVSKDAPKMYVPVSFWTEGDSIVEEIHEGNAAICYESNYVDFRIVVPIKYLLVNVNGVWKKPKTKPKRTRKVDAKAKEAKPTEPKFHIGQRVRHILTRRVDVIEGISQSAPYIYHFKHMVDPINGQGIFESDLEPYTEPTEQTEAEKKPNVGSIKIPVEVDFSDGYWDAYAADLAKEIVLKTVNSASDKRPSVIAEYAVSVAKAVVEGLKRK